MRVYKINIYLSKSFNDDQWKRISCLFCRQGKIQNIKVVQDRKQGRCLNQGKAAQQWSFTMDGVVISTRGICECSIRLINRPKLCTNFLLWCQWIHLWLAGSAVWIELRYLLDQLVHREQFFPLPKSWIEHDKSLADHKILG